MQRRYYITNKSDDCRYTSIATHNLQFHMCRNQSHLGGTEFEMSYSVHDLIYNHSKSHGDLLNVGPNFLGPNENKQERFSP